MGWEELIDALDELETEVEYDGYFCSITDVVIIVTLGSMCELKIFCDFNILVLPTSNRFLHRVLWDVLFHLHGHLFPKIFAQTAIVQGRFGNGSLFRE